ncbi:spermatogenesis-associated protein 9 isoform X2 [Malaclemys terrapin pileata]|uniref:spermatogenesis-associated protein 9 isoform X2 n=1 Tax=Malaclemys terrapin pileata TaxID=2991368 RepID=UPI0023A7B9D8|nr:spermatogenesis-associated protein 9 isoform X2 [Malaclemys terrapin pileata]
MPIKPIGWLCGQVIKRFSGQVYLIQRAVVEIIDEIKDEFPTIIGLQQSNQEIAPILQASRSVVASAFSSSPGVRVINGLNTISTSSKSVAKVLQPQLVQNFAELNTMSHRLLKNVNIPKQPLYKNQGRTFSLFDVISYPAKTALTSIMCASYAALIYVALSINTVLGKIKHIVQDEKTSRENAKNEEEKDVFSKYEDLASFPVSSPEKQVFSEFPAEDSTKSSIHILHSALDQDTVLSSGN